MLAAQTAAASAAGCEDYEGAAKKAADAASAASRKASHAREKGEAVEEEEKEKRVAPGRLDPTKQPETWGQAFQVGARRWVGAREVFVWECVYCLCMLFVYNVCV